MLKVARGGANWIVAPLTVAILMVSFAPNLKAPILVPLSAIPLFAFTFLLFFFRDPNRRIAPELCAPADGKVTRVGEWHDEELGAVSGISIFMSPLDVHVNRAPCAGDIQKVQHRPGAHRPAYSKDSDDNERVQWQIHTEHGPVFVRQISGAFARRVVPYLDPGEHVQAGDKIGLIRLGSRVDVLIPRGAKFTATEGQVVRAGTTQIGVWE